MNEFIICIKNYFGGTIYEQSKENAFGRLPCMYHARYERGFDGVRRYERFV